ncbi:septum formation initiator family protein [Glaciihabitans sp. dw_435]|uniref:FtsB family cell division protein n=1 Tax=Glaciihabitans sp. dw_435 TaxID=2720081 RepID=UPI001BD5D5A5|nr:septum formation initiator family protein [Glaciihabitans sp. dw_435]
MAPRKKKTQRVPVALPTMESAPERWLRNIRLSGFTLSMLVIVVLGVVVLAPSLKLLVEQQQEIAKLSAAVKNQQAAVDDLTSEVARWDDPAYIEAQARDRLLYVFPGEYSYLVLNGKTTATPDKAPISDSIQKTQVDWMKSMLTSVVTAGLSDATASKLVSPVIGDSQ